MMVPPLGLHNTYSAQYYRKRKALHCLYNHPRAMGVPTVLMEKVKIATNSWEMGQRLECLMVNFVNLSLDSQLYVKARHRDTHF